MRTTRTARLVAIVCLAALGLTATGQEENTEQENPWTVGKLFERSGVFLVPSRLMRFGPDACGREWDFTKEDRGNFTFFEAVDDVHATDDGALAFKLTGTTATLGWGNYGGTQPQDDRVQLWPRFILKLQARQSMDTETRFELRFWADGKRDGKGRKEFDPDRHVEVLKGKDWQELSFRMYMGMPRRDGFDFELTGPEGNQVEIKDLAMVRYDSKGHFRKEITLPDSKIWRAVAEVGAMTHLYINGKEVPSPTGSRPYGLYGNETVELSKYFEPGKVNCVAVYGSRTGEGESYLPYICMQGSVIMSSGERVLLDTDASWTWSREAEEGWKLTGFDDADWQHPTDDSGTKDNTRVAPGWCLHYKGKQARPVHDGYTRIDCPNDSQLYYTEQEDVVFHVYAPNGLDKQDPKLDWQVNRHDNGEFETLKQGTAEAERYVGRSIRYNVNIGPMPCGVYTVKLTLKAGDRILDNRIPEPFVVTRRLTMPWTDGDNLKQDMDLVLEREIDLTDPDDGPWTEAAGGKRAGKPNMDPDAGIKTPSIVQRDGLTYRETKSNSGAVISYLVEFAHPGDFYVMELDYPNDTRRMMGVACCPQTWGLSSHRSYSKTSAAVTTGDRYPITGRMQTLHWLYRPDPGNHSLNLVNLAGENPAAASRLRIYHVRNGLPALRAPQQHTRWNGLITERTRANPDRFGIRKEAPPEDRTEYYRSQRAEPDDEPVVNLCKEMEHHLDACEAFVRYMRFVGQNVHMMGSFQYNPHNPPPYRPAWDFPCGRVKGGIRDIFGRVMRDNNVDFYAHIEYIYTPKLMQRISEQPPRPDKGFWDTVYFVNEDGEEYSKWEGRYGLNFNHPLVRGDMLSVARQMARKFRTLPNFKGLLWDPYFGGDWLPGYRPTQYKRGPLTIDEITMLGYGDVTVRAFENDTGWKVPFSLDDPDRFRKRRAFLSSEAMRTKWLAWRAERTKDFFADVASALHDYRQDARCVCGLYMNPVHDLEWHLSGLPFADYMLANGWDGQRFAEDADVALGITAYGVLNQSRDGARRSGLGWEMSSDPERYAFFEAEKNRPFQVKHHWAEVEEMSWNLPYRENWPRHFQMTLMFQPDDENAREVFVRALIEADPDIFYYGFADATLFEGNEQVYREFNRVLRSLPNAKFRPVEDTGLDTNLAIRELRRDEAVWFYVANPGYWPLKARLTLEHAAEVYDAVNGDRLAKAGFRGQTTLDIDLAPFGVKAFRIAGAKATVVEWSGDAEKGPETAHLEQVIADTRQLLDTPAALVVLRPEDEQYMRERVAAASDAVADGRYAAALLSCSSDRFWVLKTEYMAKGAEYGTETTRDTQIGTAQKTATAVAVEKAPVIDGKVADAAWQDAAEYSGFIASDEMPAMAQTSFKVVHDGDAVYLAIECKDRKPMEIKMSARQKDEGSVFKDDCLAMFIQPDPKTSTYYQMAISANGVKFDQRVKGGARDYEFAPPWEVKTTVTDDGWTAEIRLPAASLDAGIDKGTVWRFNLHRAFRERKVPHNSWSYTPASWHDLERLGTLTFE